MLHLVVAAGGGVLVDDLDGVLRAPLFGNGRRRFDDGRHHSVAAIRVDVPHVNLQLGLPGDAVDRVGPYLERPSRADGVNGSCALTSPYQQNFAFSALNSICHCKPDLHIIGAPE